MNLDHKQPKRPECRDCCYFRPRKKDSSMKRGTCHHSPPDHTWDEAKKWPLVLADDWCGKFKHFSTIQRISVTQTTKTNE